MEDRTALYMVIIVGIVGLVGSIVMIMNAAPASVPADDGSGITGNVIEESTFSFEMDPAIGSVLGRLFLVVVLGLFIALVYKHE